MNGLTAAADRSRQFRAGCDDIAACLVCVDRTAIEQTVALLYDALTAAPDADLLTCQRTIGSEVRRLFDARANALTKCWDARYKGGHANVCPDPGDGKAAATIAKATSKARAKVCKACGGPDRACGGGDDFLLLEIGFPFFCPDVGACAGINDDLDARLDCAECVGAFDGGCIDALGVPSLETYPTACGLLSTSGNKTLQLDGQQDAVDLDLGFSGYAHDLAGPWLARLTASVAACAGDGNPTFGECTLAGPIPNDGGPAYENQRCSDQPWVKCATDGGCVAAGAAGPCRFFLGPPQSSTLPPLSFLETTTCFLNEITGPLAGTINIESGAIALEVPVAIHAHTRSWLAEILPPIVPSPPPIVLDQPCPTCVSGSCFHGPRDGMPCIAQGTSAVYGDEVSLDCPPDPGFEAFEQAITFPLATETKTVGSGSPTCTAAGFGAFSCPCDTCNSLNSEPCASDADCPNNPPGTAGICGGRRCLGGTNGGAPCAIPGLDPVCDGAPCGTIGEPTRPNRCITGTCTPSGATEGECASGQVNEPFEFKCTPTQAHRPCVVDSDCPFPGDTCCWVPLNCFPDGSISAVGFADPPVNGTSSPTLASLFCLSPRDPVNNLIQGLPGLARVTQPVTATVR